MGRVWFSSDHHFGHKNILDYSGRPWENVDDMNAGLIERWNSRIAPGDAVYHLGDFCLTKKLDLVDEWLGQLNGEIRLVKGNHDLWTRNSHKLQNSHKIKWIRDYAERTFTVDGIKHKLILMHFPLLFWHGSHYGSIHLHGHSHGGANDLNIGLRRMDIGVDCQDWYPVSLDEVVEKLGDLEVNPHH